jgi:thiosulfate dehydrogenase [quinone] large subunit
MAQLRTLAIPLGVIAAVLLFLLVNPWIVLEGTINQIVTVAFWLSFILLLISLFSLRDQPDAENIEVEGPAFTRFLFNNPRAGLFWLPIRLFVGFQWLEAGWHKVNDPAWVGADAGTAILGFWNNAVAIPEEGRPSITYEWYRTFLQFLIDNNLNVFFSYAIAFGELLVGIGLLVGALTGIAAFFGATMNMTFLLAGSSSSNPVLFTLAVGLMLAWKVAGYYGLDRYLLPLLGTPWRQKTAGPAGPSAGPPREEEAPGAAATG